MPPACCGRRARPFAPTPPAQAVLRLVQFSVGTLVCGAISRPMLAIVEAYGIEVQPFLAGDLRAVVGAWVVGR
jgi:hypothetical protein